MNIGERYRLIVEGFDGTPMFLAKEESAGIYVFINADQIDGLVGFQTEWLRSEFPKVMAHNLVKAIMRGDGEVLPVPVDEVKR